MIDAMIEVNERTDFGVVLTFKDGYGNLEAPVHVYIGIVDETSEGVVRAEAEVTPPASTMTIPISATETRIIDGDMETEVRTIAVRAVYADGKQATKPVRYTVRNVIGITTPSP
jgi:hypothetical protein